MGRAFLTAFFLLCAGAMAAAAQQSAARRLVPTGGMWQSLPYGAEQRDHDRPAALAANSARRMAERAAKVTPAAGPKNTRPPRRPVAAAAAAQPNLSAAAKTRELSRRIGILAPGAALDRTIADPENPPWRRTPADRAGAESRGLAMPLDETGRSGFVARGYREDPTWNNPQGNTGATVGLRTRF